MKLVENKYPEHAYDPYLNLLKIPKKEIKWRVLEVIGIFLGLFMSVYCITHATGLFLVNSKPSVFGFFVFTGCIIAPIISVTLIVYTLCQGLVYTYFYNRSINKTRINQYNKQLNESNAKYSSVIYKNFERKIS